MAARSDLGIRTVLMGVGIGSVCAVSNLYVSLKTGWTLPVMTTAVLVGFAITRALPTRSGGSTSPGRALRSSLGSAEAFVLASLASATAYMPGGGNATALPALVMLGGSEPSALVLALWFATVAVLGTLLAPLVRRHVAGELPFPTAAAAATLATTLGDDASRAAPPRAARTLGLSGVFGAAAAAARVAFHIPPTLAAPGRAGAYTFGVDMSLVLASAGALMNAKTAISTLIGAVLTYGLLAPVLVAHGLAEASYRSLVGFTVWPSAALLVSSALVELAFDVRAFGRGEKSGGFFVRGAFPLAGVAALAVGLGHVAFGIPIGLALLALPIAVAVSVVAIRVMGETDVVPTKALAPLAQLVFGAAGHGLAGPVMAPNLTSSVALHAADTAGSLEAARAAGASARTVVAARVLGCVVGGAVVTFAYRAIVPDAGQLPTAELPVPGVLLWRSVALAMSQGLDELGPAARAGIASGAAIGVALAVLGRVLPARLARWVPSAAGLGSGMVLPASNAIAIALGAALSKGARTRVDVAPIASGLIAGESLVAVLLQIAGLAVM
jgi:uncharacterized oligopeptide transporter (OPT) family protein